MWYSMRCYCCSIKKKLFESFAELEADDGKLYLCSACNDLLYKIRDDVQAENEKLYKKHLKELQSRKNNSQASYELWEKEFLKRTRL